MPFCPGATILCNDNTCVCYQHHYTCVGHAMHLGDRIRNTSKNNKLGYIYDVNPLNSRRSITICYDDETKERIFGHNVCAFIEHTGDPRDLSKINSKYQ